MLSVLDIKRAIVKCSKQKMRAKSITFCCETTLKRRTSSSHNDIEFYASEICGALNTSEQKSLAVRYEEECWCVNDVKTMDVTWKGTH